MSSDPLVLTMALACSVALIACAQAVQKPSDADVDAALREQLKAQIVANTDIDDAERAQWLDAIASATFASGTGCIRRTDERYTCVPELTITQPDMGASTEPYTIELVRRDGAWHAQTP